MPFFTRDFRMLMIPGCHFMHCVLCNAIVFALQVWPPVLVWLRQFMECRPMLFWILRVVQLHHGTF